MNEGFEKILMLLLSDDSDSDTFDSSDDEEETFLLNLSCESLISNQKILKTSIEKLAEEFTSQQFKDKFGVSRSLASLLTSQFEKSTTYRKIIENGSTLLTAKSHLLLFLWFMSCQNATLRHIAKSFRISISTVHTILFRTAKFLSNLSSDVIKWPNNLERKESSDLYLRTTGISGIVGVIGNINIKTSHFGNPNNSDNIIPVQAVCDAKNKFLDVFVGEINHVIENTLFENSNMIEKLYVLNDDEHLVGNLDFPCLQNLITPVNFNDDLNFCLDQIELCFEKLKQKFKHLNCLKIKNERLRIYLIKSCFVLYNLDCNEDMFSDKYISQEHNYSVNVPNSQTA